MAANSPSPISPLKKKKSKKIKKWLMVHLKNLRNLFNLPKYLKKPLNILQTLRKIYFVFFPKRCHLKPKHATFLHTPPNSSLSPLLTLFPTTSEPPPKFPLSSPHNDIRPLPSKNSWVLHWRQRSTELLLIISRPHERVTWRNQERRHKYMWHPSQVHWNLNIYLN